MINETGKTGKPVKVLMVSAHSIDSLCPIGYTKKNIFANADLFRIMELYTSNAYPSRTKQSDSTVTSLYIHPNRCIIRGSVPPEAVDAPMIIELEKSSAISALKKAAVKALAPCVIEKQLLEQVKEFGPDVVYTEGYDIRVLKIAYVLARTLNVQVITHTMDNWFSYNTFVHFFEKHAFMKCVKSSGSQLAISVPMIDFLREKFAVESDFIGNCVDFCAPDKDICKENNGSKVLNISFTGNLTPGRFEPIHQLLDAIDTDVELKERVRIHIYSPQEQVAHYIVNATPKQQLVIEQYLSAEAIPAVLHASDILLHVESFNIDDKNFTRYSLSTKIAEYLASKTPIFYYGPMDVGVAEFLKKNGFGYASDDLPSILTQLRRFLQTNEAEIEIAENNYERAKYFFDKAKVQRRLYLILSGACNK